MQFWQIAHHWLVNENSRIKYVHVKLSSKLIIKLLLRISNHPLLYNWAMKILIFNTYIFSWVASWFLCGFCEFQIIHFCITGKWNSRIEYVHIQLSGQLIFENFHRPVVKKQNTHKEAGHLCQVHTLTLSFLSLHSSGKRHALHLLLHVVAVVK